MMVMKEELFVVHIMFLLIPLVVPLKKNRLADGHMLFQAWFRSVFTAKWLGWIPIYCWTNVFTVSKRTLINRIEVAYGHKCFWSIVHISNHILLMLL